MSRNQSWTEAEQMKVVWHIIDSELLYTTQPRTQERKAIVDRVVAKLMTDPDFSARLRAQHPDDTIRQHIVAWIGYLERRRERPPLVR